MRRSGGPLRACALGLAVGVAAAEGAPACAVPDEPDDQALLQVWEARTAVQRAGRGGGNMSSGGEGNTSAWWSPGAMIAASEHWSRERCEAAGRLLSSEVSGHIPSSLLVHTQVPFGNVTQSRANVDPHKYRLAILSFLAAQRQSLANSSLWLWYFEPMGKPLEKLLDVVLSHPVYGKSVVLKRFDAASEFGALRFLDGPPRDRLRTLWGRTEGATKSDLARYVMLHNYGGLWVDTDTLFLKDIRPLAGKDFVHGVEGDKFFNNAVVGTSGPRSRFMQSLFTQISEEEKTGDAVGAWAPYSWPVQDFHRGVYRWGPALLQRAYEQAQHSEEELPWRVIPACLVDPNWYLDFDDLVIWERFFSEPDAPEKQVAFADPRRGEEQPFFLYHWHNRWAEPIARSSFAARVEALYVHILGLPS